MNKTPEQRFDDYINENKVKLRHFALYYTDYKSYRDGWLACHAQKEKWVEDLELKASFFEISYGEAQHQILKRDAKIKDLESQLAAKEETINNL